MLVTRSGGLTPHLSHLILKRAPKARRACINDPCCRNPYQPLDNAQLNKVLDEMALQAAALLQGNLPVAVVGVLRRGAPLAPGNLVD